MPSLIFKRVSNEDKPIWKKYRETLYHGVEDSFHESEMDSILNSKIQFTYLVFEDTKDFPVGMLELSLRNLVDGCLSSPVAYIEGIYLDESCRGKGLGKEMIEFSKDWGKENGCSELACDAEFEDLSAQNFHQKMGFQETYRIVQFKMDI